MKSLKSIDSIWCLVRLIIANLQIIASHPRNKLSKFWVSNLLSNCHLFVFLSVTLKICKQLIELKWSPRFLSASFYFDQSSTKIIITRRFLNIINLMQDFKFQALQLFGCENSVELIQWNFWQLWYSSRISLVPLSAIYLTIKPRKPSHSR